MYRKHKRFAHNYPKYINIQSWYVNQYFCAHAVTFYRFGVVSFFWFVVSYELLYCEPEKKNMNFK